MSYSGHGGLGDKYVGGGAEGSLEGEERRHDRWWNFVGVKAGQRLQGAIRALHGGTGWPDRSGHDPEFSEQTEPVTSLKRLWIRMGRRPAWWPGAQGEYNFGPTTYVAANPTVPGSYSSHDVKKPANALRINREFLGLLMGRAGEIQPTSLMLSGHVYTGPYSDKLWIVNKDGYVRLRVDDPLLAIVRANLIRYGYLPAYSAVSTKDNSAFVRALRTAYEERISTPPWTGSVGSRHEVRATTRWWPSGLNFGPNTNGNELRIHPQLLLELLIAPPTFARKRGLAALHGLKVKRPVLGPMPSVTGQYQKTALVVPRLRASAPAEVRRAGVLGPGSTAAAAAAARAGFVPLMLSGLKGK